VADYAAQVAADAEWRVATGHGARARGHAVRAVLELIGLAVLVERRALQRARRDETPLRILEELCVIDHAILRRAVGGLRERAHLESGGVEPVAAVGAGSNAE